MNIKKVTYQMGEVLIIVSAVSSFIILIALSFIVIMRYNTTIEFLNIKNKMLCKTLFVLRN